MRLLLAFTLLLSGCALPGLPELRFFDKPLDPAVLHEAVFSEAYRRVVVFSLTPPNLGQAVPSGLKKLTAIDPGFQLEPSESAIKIRRAGAIVYQSPILRADDWQGWAGLTMAAIRTSPTLRAAPPEQVYGLVLGSVMAGLDPYSRYTPPADAKAEAEWREGYGGIGVTFERRGSVFAVIDVFIGSPAAKAGLVAGESIIAVEGMPTQSLSTSDFSLKVRGPIGSPVQMTVRSRDGTGERVVTITRQHVRPTTVALSQSGSVAVLRISRFMPGTAEEFRQLARQAVWQKPSAVVIDLQHNPGGMLDSAVDVANLLLPRGPVVSTTGRNSGANDVFYAGGADVLVGLPLAVLVDGKTASSAEVLAAALQDTGRAVLVGSTTFGKGSVQNVARLPNGGEVAITWAEMRPPSGKPFHLVGLRPNLCLTRADSMADKEPCPRADSLENKGLPAVLGFFEGKKGSNP